MTALSPTIGQGAWRITVMLDLARNVTAVPESIADDIRTALQSTGAQLRTPALVDVIRPVAGTQTISGQVEFSVGATIPENVLGQRILDRVRARYQASGAAPTVVNGYRSIGTITALAPVVALWRLVTPERIEEAALQRIAPRRVVVRVDRATGAPLSPPLSTSVGGNIGLGVSSQRSSSDPTRAGEVTAREAASGAAAAAAGVGELGFPVWGYVLAITASVVVIGVGIAVVKSKL